MTNPSRPRHAGSFQLKLITVLAFWVVGLALVGTGAVWLHSAQENTLRVRFGVEVERINNDIQRRFTLPAYGLIGARGVFAASGEVSRAMFERYAASRDLNREFPGVRGLGYIARIQASQREAFEQATQDDGAPDFVIQKHNTANGQHPDLFVIQYILPLTANRQALGLDVGSEPVRRSAAERAMRTGEPTLTGAIRLVQDNQSRPGFLLYVPVYRQGLPLDTETQRVAAHRGWTYSPIVLDELMAPGRDTLASSGLRIELHSPLPQGGEEMVHEIGQAPQSPRLSHQAPLDVLGSNLTLHIYSTPEFESALNLRLIYSLGAAGFLAVSLMAAVLWLIWSGRQRAENLAEQLTQDLQKLALVAQNTTNTVIMTDPSLHITWVNDGFTRVSGYTLAEAQGKTPGELLSSGKIPAEVLTVLRTSAEKGEGCRVEVLNRAKDGHEYWIDTEVQPFHDEHGRLSGFIEIGLDITRDRQNHEALTQALLRMDDIIEGTHAGTWEWHVPTGQVVFNERWAEIVGHTLAELNPTTIDTWVRLVHPEDLARSTGLLKRHFSGETSYYECQARMRHKQGHWVWVLDRGKLSSREADGRPGWMRGTHSDITALKQVEQALRANEHRLQTLSELSAQWFWETDTNHHFTRFTCGDPERLAALNISAVGKTRWEVGTDPVSTTWQAHKDALERREPFTDFIYRLVQPNGQYSYWSTSGAPWYDEDGQFVGYIGIGSDITQSKHDELRVAKNEKLLDRTGKLAKVGAWRLDLETNTMHWSAETFRIHDLPMSQPPPLDGALDFYPPEARQQIQDAVQTAATTGQGWELEVPFISAAGRHLWVRTFGEVELLDGTPIALVGGIQDITEQKAQADALREAKQQADLASQFKSQFLANMSHEIRTPMNAILGMLQLLHGTALQPSQADYVDKAEGAAKSLLGLLNDILDFSKVEAGKMTLDPQPFALDQLTRDLSVIFSSYAQGKPVEVLFDIDPAVPRQMVGDALRLQQILINLGGNAIKFTPKGNVVLRLRLEGCTGSGNARVARVHFAVQDNGIGIAPENQDKIFAGFTQAEASTTRRFGGTGLGLSICQRLIGLMGGELTLDSALGQGSTFSFTIDLPAPETAQPAAAAPPPALQGATSALLVDDNPMALLLMERMAHSLGWEVTALTDAAAALQSVESRLASGHPYRLIVTDGQMPGMDGWELASRVRTLYTQAARPQPALLMVTSHSEDLLKQQAPEIQTLVDGYLIKPLTAPALLDAAQTALTPGTAKKNKADSTDKVQRPLSGLRLLVVEDNAVNQQVAEELLSAQGALVDIADNGERGVEALVAARDSGKPYHAVLMDMQMPVMDGIEATRHIREELGIVDLPIIAMTANAMASERTDCLQAGMNDHIGKPFNLDQLVAKLLSWTRGVGAYAPLAATDAAPTGPLTPTEAPVLDRASALQRIGGSASLLDRLLKQFLKDAGALMDEARETVAQGNLAQAQKALHTLKGSAATVGAERLAACARQAEAACKTGGPVDMPALSSAYADTQAELQSAGVASPRPHDTPPDAGADTPLTNEEREALSQLLPQLEDANMAVFDTVEALTAQHATGWQTLTDAVDSMDFEGAAAWVRQRLAQR